MGNAVRCASNEPFRTESKAPPPSSPVEILLPHQPKENSDKTSQPLDSTARSVENNPGTMEELHKKCKEVFPICFDGAKVMVNKGLSNHFQITHTLNLSQMMTGYRFGVTYVGTKQLAPQEAYPVLLADTDPSGNISATIIHQFGERLRVKLASQIQKSQLAMAQFTGEYRSPVASYALSVANPDLVNESGLLVGSYLRRITSSLDLGVELVYQYGRHIPGNQLSVLQYALRYSGNSYIASGTVSSSSLHLCYYHKQQQNLQFGVEWESNFRAQESQATFAYQADLQKANVTFRASLDTHWTVGAVLEKKLLPLPFTLALSGMLNHAQNKSRVGIGLIVG